MNFSESAGRSGGGAAGEILNMRRTVLEIKKTRYSRSSAPVTPDAQNKAVLHSHIALRTVNQKRNIKLYARGGCPAKE